LGLAIAKVIAQSHRGSISLTDNHPKGTKITVTFPKTKKLEKK
jgi:signal transduction histidine kinase